MSGGVEGDVGEGGAKCSATGPLLAASPLGTEGAAKYFLLFRLRRTRLFKIMSQGLSSNVSNSFKVSMLT